MITEASASATSSDKLTTLTSELVQYIALTKESALFSKKGATLAFWQQHERQFPILSKMAQVYLNCSAASVAVESLFSCTGFVLNSKRSSLQPEKLNIISFIHDNFKYV